MAKPHVTYSALLKQRLATHEQSARDIIVAHQGEKGRTVEAAIRGVLREILPGRYEIGTGFIINCKREISSQLDIVIYDRINNAPIELAGSLGVYPIECVFGFIEVKSRLASRDIEKYARDVSQIRRMALHKVYRDFEQIKFEETEETIAGTALESIARSQTLPPRAFLFAHDCYAKNYSTLEKQLMSTMQKYEAHVHALCILEKNWCISQRVYLKRYQFQKIDGDAFAGFHTRVLSALESFPRGSMHLDSYLIPE